MSEREISEVYVCTYGGRGREGGREKRKGERGRVRGVCIRVYVCTCVGEGEGGCEGGREREV